MQAQSGLVCGFGLCDGGKRGGREDGGVVSREGKRAQQ